MAFNDLSLLFLFFLVLSILLSSAHAIRHRTQNSETPVLSLSLHPRDSVLNPHDQNHTAWTISMPLNGSEWAPLSISAGRYVARIGVGTPVKEFDLAIDTGSVVTWLQCLPCSKCYPQYDTIFDPSQSSSYKLQSCESEQCTRLPAQMKDCDEYGDCMYKVAYADGSSSEGDYALETVTFDLSSGNLSTFGVAIGCGHYNPGIFKGSAGIMGLSWGEAAFPTQIGATSFSYCLVDPLHSVSSFSTLDFNMEPETLTSYVPMRRNPVKPILSSYYLKVMGITVGQDHIQLPPSVYEINKFSGYGGIVIDSGTTLTYLEPVVYPPVRDAFKKNALNLKPFETSYAGFETCYKMRTSYASSVKLPSLSFQFDGGVPLALPPENQLVRVSHSKSGQWGVFCLTFQPKPWPNLPSIIGNRHQRRVRFTYDLSESMIGFTLNQC